MVFWFCDVVFWVVSWWCFGGAFDGVLAVFGLCFDGVPGVGRGNGGGGVLVVFWDVGGGWFLIGANAAWCKMCLPNADGVEVLCEKVVCLV